MNSDRQDKTEKHWDAGTAGCGRLVMGLSQQVKYLQPGEVLVVTARDSAARIDLDVWCHLTGHKLESANHPYYQLRKNHE